MEIGRLERARRVLIPDAARTLGVRIVSEPGGGKSALAALIAFSDFASNLPVVLFSDDGASASYFVAQIEACPPDLRDRLRRRLRYVEVENPHFCYGLPPYGEGYGHLDYYQRSQRIIDIWVALDPKLQDAPIMGESSLRLIGTAAGMIIAAKGWSTTELPEVLLHSKEMRMARVFSEVEPLVPSAVKFFRDSYNQWSDDQRRDRRFSLESRLWNILNSRALRATCGLTRPGIDYQDVVGQRLAVVRDFSKVRFKEVRKFLSVLAFKEPTEFIEHRGIGEHIPLSVILDDLPAILEHPSLEAEVRKLTGRYRAFRVWPTVAHTGLYMLSPIMRDALWGWGNQIIGKTLEIESCLEVARNLLRYRREALRFEADDGRPYPIGETPQGQQYEIANFLQRAIKGRQFLVRRYLSEEAIDPRIYLVDRTVELGALRQVSRAQVEEAKRENMERFATRVEDALREIEGRLEQAGAPPRQARPRI